MEFAFLNDPARVVYEKNMIISFGRIVDIPSAFLTATSKYYFSRLWKEKTNY